MRSEYIPAEMIEHVLYALTPENRLACRVALKTGFRIGDVLAIKKADLLKIPPNSTKITLIESKTGKKRSATLGKDLKSELLAQSGSIWAFEGRGDKNKHRTRQAVYKDIKRAGKAFRVKENLTPHTLRKVYAVKLMKKYGNMRKVQEALNHENLAVTMIYALADYLQESKKKP